MKKLLSFLVTTALCLTIHAEEKLTLKGSDTLGAKLMPKPAAPPAKR